MLKSCQVGRGMLEPTETTTAEGSLEDECWNQRINNNKECVICGTIET